ncbi:uncharacterized protein M421DRAFT_417892 [Didymella exigua CBS 183.55]|uniref:Uncharacterized protein n=1 Tax=Didymella exigua CBS 183.55 TaxID=1150837 RepID=A0A6A5RUJ6_9PLEO|nr:uncharacterized protein M421DRAFT_417892 [Didymella exigua CBS 183.55]KAF1931239.1 hypothetical protein M421DRAFT_417892 [Didymella exigua CBS 183.55]
MVRQIQHTKTHARVEAPVRSLPKVPGEIRNRIYALANEESRVFLRRRHSKHDAEWSKKHRVCQFKGLTQVCRKLRTEFLPQYNQRTKVHIRLDEFESYLQDVLRVGHIEDRAVVGDVTAYLAGCERSIDLDLLLLVQLSGLAKGFNVRINLYRNYYLDNWVAKLLQSSRSPTIFNRIESTVQKIRLSENDEGVIGLVLQMRKGHWEEWMDHWCGDGTSSDRTVEKALLDLAKIWTDTAGVLRVSSGSI